MKMNGQKRKKYKRNITEKCTMWFVFQSCGRVEEKKRHLCVVQKIQLISVYDSDDAEITLMPLDLLSAKWKNSTSFWYNISCLLRISCPVWQLKSTLSCTHILRSHEGVELSPISSLTKGAANFPFGNQKHLQTFSKHHSTGKRVFGSWYFIASK